MIKFFLFGVAVDILIGLYTKYMIVGKCLRAGGLAVVIALVNLYAYDLIITQGLVVSAGIAFSVGCGLGTAVVTKWIK